MCRGPLTAAVPSLLTDPLRVPSLPTSRMQPRLPFALLAALCSLFVAHGDVTDRFQSTAGCTDFFYKGQPPSGFIAISQARLCQRLDGKLYFATLYDRSGRLPVYSAFIFKYREQGVPRGIGVDRSWKYEPQLAHPFADGNMTELTADVLRDSDVRRSQAAEPGYPLLLDGVAYVRGQLNPGNLQGSRGSRSATFTVSNAVTYPRPFHHRGWKPLLRGLALKLAAECRGSTAYLLSGAARQPRGRELWAPARGKGRTAVPQMLWLAFCCANGVSGAAVGHCRGQSRLALGGLLDLGPYETAELSVASLEKVLAGRLGRLSVRLFDGGCSPLPG